MASVKFYKNDIAYPKVLADKLNKLADMPDAMEFKGSLGVGGTITALPVDGSAKKGDTYKVITDGTYAGQTAKIGDLFICNEKTSSSNTWVLIPSGDEPSGTVTSVKIEANAPISVNDSTPITSSGTRIISHNTSGVNAGSYGPTADVVGTDNTTIKVPQITVDSYGHITGVAERTYTSKDTDTNTHRPIQVDGTEVLGDNVTPLNLSGGTNISLSDDGNGKLTIDANIPKTEHELIYFSKDKVGENGYDGLFTQQLIYDGGIVVDNETDFNYCKEHYEYSDNKVGMQAIINGWTRGYVDNMQAIDPSDWVYTKDTDSIDATKNDNYGNYWADMSNSYYYLKNIADIGFYSGDGNNDGIGIIFQRQFKDENDGYNYVDKIYLDCGNRYKNGTHITMTLNISRVKRNESLGNGTIVKSLSISTAPENMTGATTEGGYTSIISGTDIVPKAATGLDQKYLTRVETTKNNKVITFHFSNAFDIDTRNTVEHPINYDRYIKIDLQNHKLTIKKQGENAKTYDIDKTPRVYSGGTLINNYLTAPNTQWVSGDTFTDVLDSLAEEAHFGYWQYSTKKGRVYNNYYVTGQKVTFSNIILRTDNKTVWEKNDDGVWVQIPNIEPIDVFTGSRLNYNHITNKLFYSNGGKIYELKTDSGGGGTGSGVTSITTGTGLTGGTITSAGTISHADTSSQSSVTNTGRNYIQSIGLDDMGHVTSLTSATETVVNTDTKVTSADNHYGYASGSGKASGLYKVATDDAGHVTETTAVAKADITALGIPDSDTNTHRPIQVDGAEVLGDNATPLNLSGGTNISLSDDGNGKLTISATTSAPNNGLLTIKGDNIQSSTFSANQSSDTNLNINSSGGINVNTKPNVITISKNNIDTIIDSKREIVKAQNGMSIQEYTAHMDGFPNTSFLVCDMKQFYNRRISTPNKFTWTKNKNETGKYASLLNVTSTEGTVLYRIEISNNNSLNINTYLMGIIFDTPKDSTFTFISGLDWNVICRGEENKLYSYLEIPDSFSGTINIFPIGYHYRSGSVASIKINSTSSKSVSIGDNSTFNCFKITEDQFEGQNLSDLTTPSGHYHVDFLTELSTNISQGDILNLDNTIAFYKIISLQSASIVDLERRISALEQRIN